MMFDIGRPNIFLFYLIYLENKFLFGFKEKVDFESFFEGKLMITCPLCRPYIFLFCVSVAFLIDLNIRFMHMFREVS